MRVRSLSCAALLLGGLVMPALGLAQPQLHVSAAASLTDAMNELVARYTPTHDVELVPVYAASSTLARQIAEGAPADLFISANVKWMDWLPEQGVALDQRADLLHNRLALIAPLDSAVTAFTPGEGAPLAELLGETGRLSVGDPDHVPAGLYTRQALETLGEWEGLAPRLARASDVRGALALVERGETPAGVVYQTDARASDGVQLLGLFPADTHDPVTYPVALVNGSPSDAALAFRAWLAEEEAMAVFAAHGFSPAAPE